MAGGGQRGNTNAKKGKEWLDALRKQCVQRGTLDKIAGKVCELAEAGEEWAIKEIGNRFDGKPAQALEVSGPEGAPVGVVSLPHDPTEAARIYQEMVKGGN